jgi:hypothetical protein
MRQGANEPAKGKTRLPRSADFRAGCGTRRYSVSMPCCPPERLCAVTAAPTLAAAPEVPTLGNPRYSRIVTTTKRLPLRVSLMVASYLARGCSFRNTRPTRCLSAGGRARRGGHSAGRAWADTTHGPVGRWNSSFGFTVRFLCAGSCGAFTLGWLRVCGSNLYMQLRSAVGHRLGDITAPPTLSRRHRAQHPPHRRAGRAGPTVAPAAP